MPHPTGGLWLWCRLPDSVATPMAWAAARYGLRVTPGPRFAADPAFENYLRLPYTLPPEVLVRAADLLSRSAEDVATGSTGRADLRLDPTEQVVV